MKSIRIQPVGPATFQIDVVCDCGANALANEKTGERREIPIRLDRILAGKAPDPILRSRDIVFIPNSKARSAFYRSLEVALGTISGVIVYRR